jgi:hypothetical protein
MAVNMAQRDSLLFLFADRKLDENQHVRYDGVEHLEVIGK